MKRHSRAHVWVQRERAIRRWQRYYREVENAGSHSGLREYERWEPIAGKLVKFTKSCDCAMCRIDRRDRSFKAHKRAFYRELDRLDLETVA